MKTEEGKYRSRKRKDFFTDLSDNEMSNNLTIMYF